MQFLESVATLLMISFFSQNFRMFIKTGGHVFSFDLQNLLWVLSESLGRGSVHRQLVGCVSCFHQTYPNIQISGTLFFRWLSLLNYQISAFEPQNSEVSLFQTHFFTYVFIITTYPVTSRFVLPCPGPMLWPACRCAGPLNATAGTATSMKIGTSWRSWTKAWAPRKMPRRGSRSIGKPCQASTTGKVDEPNYGCFFCWKNDLPQRTAWEEEQKCYGNMYRKKM